MARKGQFQLEILCKIIEFLLFVYSLMDYGPCDQLGCLRNTCAILALQSSLSHYLLLIFRMAANGVQPNTKTFTALIGSVGKMSTLEQAMEIIEQLLCHEKDTENLTSTYSALMSACEKAGQWDLAVALFDKMSSQVCLPFVGLFNGPTVLGAKLAYLTPKTRLTHCTSWFTLAINSHPKSCTHLLSSLLKIILPQIVIFSKSKNI